ncbi:MAG TPA: hypothetical protein VJ898_03415 [Natrialbaceae archaeon]|nr:hypothetical protein [Natrialbaceae archaeon]
MNEPSEEEGPDRSAESSDEALDTDAEESTAGVGAEADESADDVEAIRRQVDEEYDFDDFGPEDMERMSAEEWEVAFDADTWITGEELLDRVRTDLEARIADRHVFAVLEDVQHEGQRCLLAYSDDDYALVYPDGSVEGFGTVLRDVKPVVALCSMERYDPLEPPAEVVLPTPDEVPEATGELGNFMLQIVAAVQGVAGIGLLIAAATVGGGRGMGTTLMAAAGLGFLAIAVLLFFTVANARLSDRFRAEEYRERLREVGLEDGERPEFLPVTEESGARDDRPDS